MAKAKPFDGDESSAKQIDKKTGTGASILRQKGRTWLLTLNNPQKHDVDISKTAVLKKIEPLTQSGTISYIASINEISITANPDGEHTPHTHLVIYAPNQIRGSQLHKYFPTAALQVCQADVSSVVEYIEKDTGGSWYNKHPEKLAEKLPAEQADFWQWGDKPTGVRHTASKAKVDYNALILNAIQDGKTDAEILKMVPPSWHYSSEIRKVRFALLSEHYRSIVRQMTCIYIEAPMPLSEMYSLISLGDNVYIVPDYCHPWDSYCQQDTVVLINFTKQFSRMLLEQYLSGGFCTLSSRFSDAVACYTTIIIVSPVSIAMLSAALEFPWLEDYITHLRIYKNADDIGKYYIKCDKSRKAAKKERNILDDGEIKDNDIDGWERIFLLPEHL